MAPNPGASATKHAIGSTSTLAPNLGASAAKHCIVFRRYAGSTPAPGFTLLIVANAWTSGKKVARCPTPTTGRCRPPFTIAFFKFSLSSLNLTLHVRIHSSGLCADLRCYLCLGFLPCSPLKLRDHSCYRSSTILYFYFLLQVFSLNLPLHVRIYSSVFDAPMCGPETLSYSRVSSVFDAKTTESLLLPILYFYFLLKVFFFFFFPQPDSTRAIPLASAKKHAIGSVSMSIYSRSQSRCPVQKSTQSVPCLA